MEPARFDSFLGVIFCFISSYEGKVTEANFILRMFLM